MKEHNEGGERKNKSTDSQRRQRTDTDSSSAKIIHEKKLPPRKVFPESIFRLSFNQADELAEHPYSGKVHSSTSLGFARIAQQNEDLETVQYWTQRLEAQIETTQPRQEGIPDTDFAAQNHLAQLYFIGATLGDTDSFSKLETLLTDERDTYYDEGRSFHELILTDIVWEAALSDIPADRWIDRFAKDQAHGFELKYYYAETIKERNSQAKLTASRYMTEITSALFQEETSDEIFWRHATGVMKYDEDQGKCAAIIHEAILRANNAANEEQFSDFLTFASQSLEDNLVTQEQARDIHSLAENYALEHQITNDTKVSLSRIDLSLALLQDTPAEELLAQIKSNTQFQREHTLSRDNTEDPFTQPRYARELVDIYEDSFLRRCVRHFAKKHDFQSANTFIHEITNQSTQLTALMQCLQEVQTPQEIALFKDKAPQNEKMQCLIYAQELYLTHRPENRALAFELLTQDPFMLQLAETWLKKKYETSIAEGQIMAYEILAAINLRPQSREFESTVARVQLDYDDSDGFHTRYNYLKRMNSKAYMYLLLAAQCQEWINTHPYEEE